MRAVETAGAEPDPAAAPAEDRRARERTIGAGAVLVTRQIHVELLPANEAFGMRDEHAPRGDSTQTELVLHEHGASPANRESTMAESELRRDDHDVTILTNRSSRKHLLGARHLAEILLRQSPIAAVVERPRGLDGVEYRKEGRFVGVAQLLGPHHSEPSFGTNGQCELRKHLLDPLERLGDVKLREDLLERLHLGLDRLQLVLARIGGVGLRLLVGVLVTDRELLYRLRESHRKLRVLVEDLRCVVVETSLRVLGPEQIRGLAPLRVVGGDRRRGQRCLRRHRHSPFFIQHLARCELLHCLNLRQAF